MSYRNNRNRNSQMSQTAVQTLEKPAQDRTPVRAGLEHSARTAVRTRDVLRKDCQPAMRKICSGWEYSHKRACELGNDDVGYYQSEAKIVDIDPDDAYDLFVYHNYDRNRNFDQSHSSSLSSAMRLAPSIDIAIGPDNFPVILNGQHTMWAIHMRGQTTQASVTIYQCKDEHALANLFSIFDSNKTRTLAQAISAHKGTGDVLDMDDISPQQHHRWTQCVAAAENGFSRSMSKATLMDKVQRAARPEIIEFSKWMQSLVENGSQVKLVHQGVGAAFYAMFRSNRTKAAEFIKKYLSGIGIDNAHDPVGQVRNRMSINKPFAEHGPTACHLHAGIVYSAWRAFCLNRPLMQMRATKDLPQPDRWQIYPSATAAAAIHDDDLD